MKSPKQPAPRFESAGCFDWSDTFTFSLPLNESTVKNTFKLNVNSCGHDDRVPHELPCPTSLITPSVYHSRPPVVETDPRFSDYRSNNSIYAGGKTQPTAGFRCGAVAQSGTSVNLGISVGGNIGKAVAMTKATPTGMPILATRAAKPSSEAAVAPHSEVRK